MSQQSELELQRAVFDALRSDAPLAELLAETADESGPAVYDHVPQAEDPADGTKFPYVVVGEDTQVSFDTDTELGFEATVTVHSFSVHKGRMEVKQIQGAIYACLHRRELVVDGYDTVDCIWEYSDSAIEPDGVTRHGVQRFRITVQGNGPT